jgi:hypothetical protein
MKCLTKPIAINTKNNWSCSRIMLYHKSYSKERPSVLNPNAVKNHEVVYNSGVILFSSKNALSLGSWYLSISLNTMKHACRGRNSYINNTGSENIVGIVTSMKPLKYKYASCVLSPYLVINTNGAHISFMHCL